MFYPVVFIVILIVTIIGIIILNKKLRNPLQKVFSFLFPISFSFYTGFGLCYSVYYHFEYLLDFIIFFFVFIYFFIIGVSFQNKHQKNIVKEKVDRTMISLSSFCIFLYFITYLILLLYPTNKITYTLAHGFFVRTNLTTEVESLKESSIIIHLVQTLNTLCIPFLYFYLYKCKSIIKAICIVFLDFIFILFNYYGYIGRSGMIFYLFELMFIIVTKINVKKTNTQIWKNYKKTIKKFIAIFIILVPFLFMYTGIRSGDSGASNKGLFNLISLFIRSESDFPKHYSYALAYSNQFNPLYYFNWLITLPIPKIGFSFNNIMSLNSEYSKLYIMEVYSRNYDTIVLPSLLGEGYLLYGRFFFWIHAIVLGLIVGYMMGFLTNSKARLFLGIYIIAELLQMPRGGSQGSLAVLINHNLVLIVISCITFLSFANSRSSEIKIKRGAL